MWSGLGYYSRAQRLWEAAKKVMNIFKKPQFVYSVVSNTINLYQEVVESGVLV